MEQGPLCVAGVEEWCSAAGQGASAAGALANTPHGFSKALHV